MTLTLTFYCPVLVFPTLTCIAIFVRSSAPVHATGLCSNIMNIRRWYYHILNSRLWWRRGRFVLFRRFKVCDLAQISWIHSDIHVFLNSRFWWRRRRFELFRRVAKLFETKRNGPTVQSTVTRNWKTSRPYFACQNGSNSFNMSSQNGSNHLRIVVYFFSGYSLL